MQAQHSSMSLQLRKVRDSSLFLSAFASLAITLLLFFRFLFLGVSGWEVGTSTSLVCYLPDLLREESICSSVRWGIINFIFSATISTGVGPTYPSWPYPYLLTWVGKLKPRILIFLLEMVAQHPPTLHLEEFHWLAPW